MTKITCYKHGGGTITFEGVEADRVADFLQEQTTADLDDEDTHIIVGATATVERSKEGVNIKL